VNETNLRLDNVYHLEAVMRIFEKASASSIVGSEPSRMRNRFGWRMETVHRKRLFIRREIQATALILDGIESGRLAKPYSTSMWAGWVESYAQDTGFEKLRAAVQASPMPRYQRSVIESARLAEIWPPGRFIGDFWTVEQMAESIGISRESVYKRSDIRLGDGLGLTTIDFCGMRLWYPLAVTT
jgi:hypothetical protein